MEAPKRILVIRIGRLGDTILATPIVQALQQAYGPQVLIDFAVSPGAGAAILGLDQRINRVFSISRRRLPWYLNRSKRMLRKHSSKMPYDLVFNLECGAQCDDFIQFIRSRAFFGRPLTKPVHIRGRHCVDTEKTVYAGTLGAEAAAAAVPSLQLPPDLENHAGGVGADIVILNPGFSGVQRRGYPTHRRWPDRHWIQLIDLITGSGRAVAINGSMAEKRCFQSLLDRPGVSSLFGCSLSGLVKAMAAARCVISVDTGSMHLAAALGVPVIALFGPTDPNLTGPYPGMAAIRVLTSGVDCQPCFQTPLQKQCRWNRCMQELSPESVYEAFENMVRPAEHTLSGTP